MYEVYQQLNELTRKTDEQELRRKRDEHVNKLESSLKWYEEEALKLREMCKTYKKEWERWKERVEIVEEERKMLEIQLKVAKKQIKAYNEQAQNHISEAESVHFPAVHRSEVLPKVHSAACLSALLGKISLFDPQLREEIEAYMRNQEAKWEEGIKHLQSAVDGEKRKAKAAAASQASAFLANRDLEGIFLECVEEVRREVQKRRTLAIISAKYTTKAAPKEPKSAFTPKDKRRIMDLLVGNEQVLVFLYEKLFPYRGNSIVHARTSSEATPLPPEDLQEAGFVHRGRTVRVPQ
jgi:DNA repair exonuclease SbcCD ATPase subunit